MPRRASGFPPKKRQSQTSDAAMTAAFDAPHGELEVSSIPGPHPAALRYAERHFSHRAIQKIVVVVDPTASAHPCIEKAARIAASCKSSIELYVCDVEQGIPDSWAGGDAATRYRALRRKQYLDELERLAAKLRLRGIAVTCAYEYYSPVEHGITKHVISTRPDLVLKTLQRRFPVPGSGLTDTDRNLIRLLDAPLLLVRDRPWSSQPVVAVAVDPCRPTERPVALDEALFATGCSVAASLAGHIELLHVLEPAPHLPGATVEAEVQREADERALAAVQALVRPHCAPVTAVRSKRGRIPEKLVEMTRDLCPDLLVIGAAARDRLTHLGSSTTAGQVMQQIECDMLIVRPPGYVSPLMSTA
jgi:universal stress protein E